MRKSLQSLSQAQGVEEHHGALLWKPLGNLPAAGLGRCLCTKGNGAISVQKEIQAHPWSSHLLAPSH